uniref:relaxase/mobilization nuclease domain-containing protein n=1 Tax=Enterocloster clostridioformis TaxID=1531 RepID=UPI001C3E87AA|nr:relaxase/mobilization nuclease domain-containing protein [Enterocloster clostridioformis]
MAYTKIHAITATVNKAVDYICSSAKTDEGILISSYGCSPETAAYDFKFALSKTSQSDPNKAYHLIQSFLPGEVSYKEAHQIGMELADKLLEGKYSYVVTTHIDKGHVHNHIIFCAADNVNHEKYHDCKKTYYDIRSLSDDLCQEHELSIITPGAKTLSAKDATRGKTYKEWQAGKNGSAWKEQLKADIDEAIKNAATYEDCIELIRAKGYEVKGEDFGEKAHKFISFRPLDRERFVRGSAKSLGTEYTKERIRERIEEKALAKDKMRVPFPARKKPIVRDYSKKNLIDTTEDKFASSPGLKHWADIQNLKIAAASYSQAGSIAELEKQIAAKSTLAKTARRSLVETERQLKDLGQVLKYAEQYKANHIYHVRYKKSKDKDAYLRRHETELILHDGAENMLKRFGIDAKNLDVEKLLSDYNALYVKKQDLQKTYKSAEKETADLNRKLDNLSQYLDRNPEQQVANKKLDKRTQSL